MRHWIRFISQWRKSSNKKEEKASGVKEEKNMLRKRIYAWKNRGMALLLAGITAFGMTAVPAFAEEQTETEAAMQSVLPNGREVYNVLLIGSDRRNDSWNGNSDVMIVMSVNAGSKKLSLTSFMRDLYADIPGYGVHKLNYAYAAGGAKTLMETLEDNYELPIDNYAVVDFETMAKVVDLVGGVEIEVSDAECKVLNDYLTSMNAADDYLPGGGSYVLNGNQAVAYMRIRYVGNNDYERTQRQRDVLGVIFASMQKLDAEQLTKLVDEILPNVENDITPVDMIRLMALLPDIGDYELSESRIPYDGLFTSQNEMLVPDFAQTKERLHEELYGE